jgi:hypothetical protein
MPEKLLTSRGGLSSVELAISEFPYEKTTKKFSTQDSSVCRWRIEPESSRVWVQLLTTWPWRLYTCIHAYISVYNKIVTKLFQIVETRCADSPVLAGCWQYLIVSMRSGAILHTNIHTYILTLIHKCEYIRIYCFIKRECKWRKQRYQMDVGEHTNIRMVVNVVMILYKKEKCKKNFLRDRNRSIWTRKMQGKLFHVLGDVFFRLTMIQGPFHISKKAKVLL